MLQIFLHLFYADKVVYIFLQKSSCQGQIDLVGLVNVKLFLLFNHFFLKRYCKSMGWKHQLALVHSNLVMLS